jgi:hypothetical protein
VLIIHVDDVGASHGSNLAAFEGMLHGSLTCGSALVPAPWFAETVKLQRQHPEADLGIHMTLTAEYETFRWRSVSGRPSLHAPDGGMWRTVAEAVHNVPVEDAAEELRAQVELALSMGLDVTHLDTHMGTVMDVKFLEPYVDLALEYRLPLFFIRPNDRRLAALGERAPAFVRQTERLDAAGWPVLDHIITKTLSEIAPEEKETRFREMFDGLRPGLTHFLVHPAAASGDELEAMASSTARHRAKEHEIFRTPAMREYCEERGIKLTGYREIRDRLRANLGAAK